jgi:hypothetical protein
VDSNIAALFETIFDVVYLIVVWGLVALMASRMASVSTKNRSSARLFLISFILLAAGDSGHVGFRVAAQLMNAMNQQVPILGAPMNLIGVGMLTTAYTVTLFYMVLVYIWMDHFNQKANWFTYFLLAIGIVRLVFMALPANDWGNLVPPQPISLYRNIFLMIQGIGIIGLYLVSAYRSHDRTFKWIGWSIVASFVFYTPVILFAQTYPTIGMLMIPKTIAYVAVAIIAYNGLWKAKKA